MGIVIAILIFGLIIAVHEYGHFICAKLSGVNVLEFSLGMGPKIFQKRHKDTLYSLRILPIGGYCAMEGEDDSSGGEGSFRNAKLWKRMIVLAAGATMNFILGFIAIVVLMCMMTDIPTTQIQGFAGVRNDDGTATYYAKSYETGLRHDDVILKIDGTPVFTYLDINFILLADTSNTTHDLVVKRNGERVKLNDVTFGNTSEGGGVLDFGLVYLEKNPLTVVTGSGKMFMSMGQVVGLSMKYLFTGKVSKEEVSGPVGVVSTINETAQESESMADAIFNLLYITSLITINVGIFNLLPIPGLDGGRLLFCFIELIRRKPVKPEHEGIVHLVGMALLFGIMIFATYNDIMRLITG